MNAYLKFAMLCVLLVLSLPTMGLSGETSDPVEVISIRPYNLEGAPGAVFFSVSETSVCDTTTYKVDLSFGGAQAIYTMILAAFLNQHRVIIEISNTAGCTGWGSVVQSVTIAN